MGPLVSTSEEAQGYNQEQDLRRRWIGVFSRTPSTRLKRILEHIDTGAAFEILRPAEQGLVMVRARAGGSGQKFNMGEMTVVRCSVRSGAGYVGHGYAAGRNLGHVEISARLDALMQEMPGDTQLGIVNELEAEIAAAGRARQQKSAPTKVEFFTMVRGEDE